MSWVRESSLWQIAVEESREQGREEGRLEELRRLVLHLGARRLGPPDPSIRDSIARLDDVATLERMIERTFIASSWQEPLASE